MSTRSYPRWRCHVASGLRHRDARRNARSFKRAMAQSARSSAGRNDPPLTPPAACFIDHRFLPTHPQDQEAWQRDATRSRAATLCRARTASLSWCSEQAVTSQRRRRTRPSSSSSLRVSFLPACASWATRGRARRMRTSARACACTSSRRNRHAWRPSSPCATTGTAVATTTRRALQPPLRRCTSWSRLTALVSLSRATDWPPSLALVCRGVQPQTLALAHAHFRA